MQEHAVLRIQRMGPLLEGLIEIGYFGEVVPAVGARGRSFEEAGLGSHVPANQLAKPDGHRHVGVEIDDPGLAEVDHPPNW